MIAEMLAELRAARAALNDPIEGFRDVTRLDVKAPTAEWARTNQALFQKRADVLDAALNALRTLEGDGYPDLAPIPAPAGVAEDVAEQFRTLTAARGFLTPERAAALNLTAGQPQQK